MVHLVNHVLPPGMIATTIKALKICYMGNSNNPDHTLKLPLETFFLVVSVE
jgi:hypothetical protein